LHLYLISCVTRMQFPNGVCCISITCRLYIDNTRQSTSWMNWLCYGAAVEIQSILDDHHSKVCCPFTREVKPKQPKNNKILIQLLQSVMMGRDSPTHTTSQGHLVY
jgi:hypothetical protein